MRGFARTCHPTRSPAAGPIARRSRGTKRLGWRQAGDNPAGIGDAIGTSSLLIAGRDESRGPRLGCRNRTVETGGVSALRQGATGQTGDAAARDAFTPRQTRNQSLPHATSTRAETAGRGASSARWRNGNPPEAIRSGGSLRLQPDFGWNTSPKLRRNLNGQNQLSRFLFDQVRGLPALGFPSFGDRPAKLARPARIESGGNGGRNRHGFGITR